MKGETSLACSCSCFAVLVCSLRCANKTSRNSQTILGEMSVWKKSSQAGSSAVPNRRKRWKLFVIATFFVSKRSPNRSSVAVQQSQTDMPQNLEWNSENGKKTVQVESWFGRHFNDFSLATFVFSQTSLCGEMSQEFCFALQCRGSGQRPAFKRKCSQCTNLDADHCASADVDRQRPPAAAAYGCRGKSTPFGVSFHFLAQFYRSGNVFEQRLE